MPNIIPISNDVNHKVEHWTGKVLYFGVWISASLMITGLLIAAIYPSTIMAFSSNPTLGNLIMRILSGSFDPATLMFAGLVFLMFTPILRVITAVFGFWVERDWQFVFVSFVVLLLLSTEIVYSIFIK